MKPGNILIAEDGTVKISDFGSSRYYGSPNREMTSKITTRYHFFLEIYHDCEKDSIAPLKCCMERNSTDLELISGLQGVLWQK